jgi:hypothetical protein
MHREGSKGVAPAQKNSAEQQKPSRMDKESVWAAHHLLRSPEGKNNIFIRPKED